MKTDERHYGRAKNALLSFIEKRLSVPKVYFDATWAGEHVDVLAIDRDGVGDVHTFLLRGTDLPVNKDRIEDSIEDLDEALAPLIDRLLNLPSQYKYIAFVNLGAKGVDPLPGIPHESIDKSYDAHGIGRIGFLSIDTSGEDDPRTKVVLKPERFRARVAILADEYIEHHSADWEIRA